MQKEDMAVILSLEKREDMKNEKITRAESS